jgi:hypothetical protein
VDDFLQIVVVMPELAAARRPTGRWERGGAGVAVTGDLYVIGS